MKDYSEIVEKILRAIPATRDDDHKLYVWVVSKLKPELMNEPFGRTFFDAKSNGLPSYESITRARRKAQEKHPDLRDKNKAPEYYEEMNELCEACEMAIKALENPRWIPVTERLPDKNMHCLVSVGKFNFTQIAMYSDLMGTINHKIFWQGDYGKNNFQNITEYVNAWQPLPESYKKEEQT